MLLCLLHILNIIWTRFRVSTVNTMFRFRTETSRKVIQRSALRVDSHEWHERWEKRGQLSKDYSAQMFRKYTPEQLIKWQNICKENAVLFLYILALMLLLLLLGFCFTTVSRKMFLSQPITSTFCAFNSSLQQPQGESEGVMREWHMVWKISVETLNWEHHS